jgi:hypothetical protein
MVEILEGKGLAFGFAMGQQSHNATCLLELWQLTMKRGLGAGCSGLCAGLLACPAKADPDR